MTKQLSTGTISDHFGIDLPAKFIIDTLGVPNTARDKRAFLWDESLIPQIARALVNHVADRGNTPFGSTDANDDLF